MKKIVAYFLHLFLRILISLRYRIKVDGLDLITPQTLPKRGGVLFLANHPAEIDPLILLVTLWYPFKPHPIAIDYLFRMPIVRTLLDFVGALSIPNFDGSSNSYKRKQIEKTYKHIFSLLDKKENLLIYPAGSLKSTPHEEIGGASGVHTILEASPDINVVLIRTTGLWGSSFSRALTGKTPNVLQTFLGGFKILLRNGIFFAPRREVLIELFPAPSDFPQKTTRKEFNRYLEKFYNARGPEPLNLVSYSCFREEYPAVYEKSIQEEVSLDTVPEETRRILIEEIAKLSRTPPSEITLESHLSHDLGLDSLDTAQLVVTLKEDFGIQNLHSSDLSTVGSVIAYAALLATGKEEEERNGKTESIWEKEKNRPPPLYPEGETLIEVFLKTCERMDKHIACVDQVSGEVTYKRLKMGVILCAEYLRKLPGERIGILMPASIGVNAMILATMLAGKVPVMINWTLGERSLRSVVEQSAIDITLTAWSFLDRLDSVELNGIDDQILLFEEVRRSFSLFDKLKAVYRSKIKREKLLKIFGVDRIKTDDPAVILFTSGTESYPKGVPLSHHNLLVNQRGVFSLAEIQRGDVLLGALPPFHSFGFSITSLFPLVTGLRVAFSPNPTDGKRMGEAIERWDVTILCLAPTFLKNIVRVSTVKQLRTLRMVVTGAEKTAAELFVKLRELNAGAILVEGYGITECAPVLTLNPPSKPVQGVGLPLPGVEILIVDPDSYIPLTRGERGLILARGPNVFRGYIDSTLSSPFVTCASKSWYLTGDLGYLDEKGYLILSGRLKRFVKVGGEMVSLTSIEETLLEAGPRQGWKINPDVPSLAVCALEQEGKKSEMHLITTFDTTADVVNQVLRENGMSNIIKIRSVIKVPVIPLLGTGKIDYRSLSARIPKITNGDSA